jgi:hypothetical protein
MPASDDMQTNIAAAPEKGWLPKKNINEPGMKNRSEPAM